MITRNTVIPVQSCRPSNFDMQKTKKREQAVQASNDKFLKTIAKGYGYSPEVKVLCVATKPKEAGCTLTSE